MRLRYSRWQGLLAAAAVVAFILATRWRYPGIGIGVGLLVIVFLKTIQNAVGRIQQNAKPPQ